MITIAADGENSILLIPGANTTVNCEYVRSHGELITGAELVLLQGEIPAVGFREAVHQATGRVVVNLAPLIEVNPQTLLEADPLLANEHEAGLILDRLGVKVESGEPRDLVRGLLGAGFASVVLTLGAAGALVGDESGLVDAPPSQPGWRPTPCRAKAPRHPIRMRAPCVPRSERRGGVRRR